MDSEKLSERTKQPGHDQTFRESERNFIVALEEVLPSDGSYRVLEKPRNLDSILGGYGIIPEASIEHVPTGRKMYFEVKKQGTRGNADERACKHHTVQFYKTLAEHTGYEYHAFATIMCEALSWHERYTTKHPFYFEEEHYFLWEDYKLAALKEYIDMIRERFLEAESDTVPQDSVPA